MFPIHLLYLLNTFTDDSLSRTVLNVVRGLSPERYVLHVGCMHTGGPMADELSTAGARVINFGMRGYYDVGVIGRVGGYVRVHGIRAVHTQILRADLVGWLATRLAKTYCLLATKHNLGYAVGQERRTLRNALYYASVYLPDVLVTVSDQMRQCLLSLPGMGNARLVTIHNGIDAERYFVPQARQACRRALDLADDQQVIGYLGRLVAGKGLETLVQAMPAVLHEHPGARLLLVGEGPLHGDLQRLARENDVSSAVTLLGFRADVPQILAALDVFVLPSMAEGLPLSVLEAMAAAKPIVATPVGGIVELIEQGVTGLLVAPSAPQALAQAIIRLLQDSVLSRDLGSRAHAKVLEHFSLERMVRGYDSLYQELLGR